MKILFSLMFLIFAMGASAQENLSVLKRNALDHIGRDMATLEGNKTCIDNARTVEAFKNCGYDAGDWKMQKEEIRRDRKTEGMHDDASKVREGAMDKKKKLEKSY